MSAYYLIGSDIEQKNLDKLNVGFEPIKVSDLKKYIKNVDFTKNYYYVSDFLMNMMTYDSEADTNSGPVFYDENGETDLGVFIKYLISEKIEDTVEFYKFWSMFDNPDAEINEIYYTKEIITPNHSEKEDFEFNTKYVFLNNELE